MTWSVWDGSEGHRHVVPDEDLRPHRHSLNCWCRPKPDEIDPEIMVHSAMDARERFEDRPAQ